MGMILGLLKLLLKIVAAPVVLLLTVAIWTCVGLVYVSGLVLGLLSMVIAFLISPFGLPKLAFWLLGQVQGLKYAIQDLIYG